MADDIADMMDRNLALEAVRVTEAAALSASRLMGRGDEKAADQAAVDAMRQALNSAGHRRHGRDRRGRARRGADALYRREGRHRAGPKIDIALDPLEGTTITAKGGPNALAVIAMAEAGGFLNAPDVYMDKIAIGRGLRRRGRSRRHAGRESQEPRQGQEIRGRRSRRLHPRPRRAMPS